MLTAGRGEVTIDVRKPCVIHNSRKDDSILSKSLFGGVDEVREAGIGAKSNLRQVVAAVRSSYAAAVPLMATLLQGDETRDEESLPEEKDDEDDETTCGEESVDDFLIRLLGRLSLLSGSAATVAA